MRESSGTVSSLTALGPFFEHKEFTDRSILALRPLYVKFSNNEGRDHWHILYPLFNRYNVPDGGSHQSLLGIIRWSNDPQVGFHNSEVWPFWFNRQTGDAETSYTALWPLHGRLRNRLFREQIDFTLWPLYVRTERRGRVYHHFPYPFIRTLSGEGNAGFGIWPVYGSFQSEGEFNHTWALWPLIYNRKTFRGRHASAETPYHQHAFLPFYHRETAIGMSSTSIIWPFFGRTSEFEPRASYDETRLLWPFWVQGRGEERYINRWLPLFSHETVGDSYRKNWVAWPVVRTERWQDAQAVRERQSVLFFLYRNDATTTLQDDREVRRSVLWPLAANWNDGAGRSQFQLLDPFSTFFPRNEKIRENWAPLFAVYRYNRSPESIRHSLLWNLFSHERTEEGRSFHLGPLFSRRAVEAGSDTRVLGGLLRWQYDEGQLRFSAFWVD